MQTVLKKKSLGILMHPSSIPGGKVCGTFGRGAKEWIKKLSKHGIEYWQFLPLTPTDSTGSPYSSPSSFALNPWFLDMDDLIEKGFIFISKKEELELKNQNKNHFDFHVADDLSKKLGSLLLKCWDPQPEEKKIDFCKWLNKNSWVDDYATFIVIREEFNMLPWWQWPKEFKIKNNKFLKSWIKERSEKILIKKLIQWHLDRQWKSVKDFAKSYNVKLIGDLPFYVSRDSADVWSNKSLFSIFKNGALIFQSGVPPDYFSSTGQLWGTPTYFWSKHNGDDILFGGSGNDEITGGSGNDTYQLTTGTGRDLITDYTQGEDSIELLNGITTNDLTFSSTNGNLQLHYNSDLLATIENTIQSDLNFI